jgi:hypothetical protein
MRQEPYGRGCRAQTTLGAWRGVIKITVEVENINVFRRYKHERLGGSHDDAAVAADQQGNLALALQVGHDVLAHAIPRDTGSRPVPDRRDRVVGKVAGDGDVPPIDRAASGCPQPLEELDFAIGLRVVFIAGVQGTGAEGNS